MTELTPKLPGFNRTKSADNVPGQKFELQRQMTKESLMANDFNWIIEPKLNKNGELFGGLALGWLKMVEKEEELNRLNIGAVVSVYKQKNVFINPKIKHLRVFVSEHSRENINSVFLSSSKFISSNLARTNVLVVAHTYASKSSLVVAAYLMRQRSLSSKMAVEEVRRKRKAVLMNESLLKQLTSYEKQLARKQSEGNSNACEIM